MLASPFDGVIIWDGPQILRALHIRTTQYHLFLCRKGINTMESKKNTSKKYEIDMVHGPLLGKVLLFSLPLMASGVLQLLFNAADIIVVGRFNGPQAIAAVGSTTALINLLVSLGIGLSVGVNVTVSRFFGAGDEKNCRATVQSSIALAWVLGFLIMAVGLIFSRPILILMGAPDDIIDLSALYLRIFFSGMPVVMLYNFGSAVLRGVGDTRRPLIYLTIAGVLNVCMNLFFVIVFHLGVAGVALATILSQAVSAFLVVRSLVKYDGMIRFDPAPAKLRPDMQKIGMIFNVGLPAGFQSMLFSLSNVTIQSAVNSFGSAVMAGNAAAQNIEGFVYMSMNALMQAAVTFTSANVGAREEKRVTRVMLTCIGVVTAVGLLTGRTAAFFGNQLLSIYTSDAQTILYGQNRLNVTCANYFLCGLMDTLCGCLRGLGFGVFPMVISLLGSVVLRIVWVFTIFAAHHEQWVLYISYPITWIITGTVEFFCFMLLRKKAFARFVSNDKI